MSKQNASYLQASQFTGVVLLPKRRASQQKKKKENRSKSSQPAPSQQKKKEKNAPVMPASSQSAILSQTCTFDAELCGQNTFKSGLKC